MTCEKWCDSESCSKFIILNHNGQFYRNWTRGISYLCILSSFLYAGCAAFSHKTYDDDWRLIFCETLFAIDMFIKFFVDYPDPRGT